MSKYRQQIKDSAYTAVVVGTILIFINHTDAIISLSFTAFDLFQWLANYIVPFLVSLYSRIGALKKESRNKKPIGAWS